MRALRSAAIVALAFFAIGTSAHADGSRYEGPWSVAMVKHVGLCDRSSRYAIVIREGAIRYLPEPGDAPMNFTGRVDAGGKVEIYAARGPARVAASGQLRRASGSGTWRLPLLGCSGTWTAQRGHRVQTAAQ
jgi:hypothetical protein